MSEKPKGLEHFDNLNYLDKIPKFEDEPPIEGPGHFENINVLPTIEDDPRIISDLRPEKLN